MRVESGADVTLVTMVYRSLEWLDWCITLNDASTNNTKYRWLVVANDATPEVRADPRVSIDFSNENPEDFYINRVYSAWNEGVLNAPTKWVVLLNNDMTGADYWLDSLIECRLSSPRSIPTSLLVESGRLPSGMPEFVYDFGKNPVDFDENAFLDHAKTLKKPGKTEPGRLYMPILLERQEFFDVGGYPPGNPPSTTGDKDLIRRYKEAGYEHLTCLGSVCYHVQTGEQEWPTRRILPQRRR